MKTAVSNKGFVRTRDEHNEGKVERELQIRRSKKSEEARKHFPAQENGAGSQSVCVSRVRGASCLPCPLPCQWRLAGHLSIGCLCHIRGGEWWRRTPPDAWLALLRATESRSQTPQLHGGACYRTCLRGWLSRKQIGDSTAAIGWHTGCLNSPVSSSRERKKKSH